MDLNVIPYKQARGFGGARGVTQVVVMHATDNTADAAAEAGYAAVRTDQVSCHYFVDETQIIQVVPLNQVAWGCLYHGNQISVQIELCGLSNRISDATMRRAAPLVAALLAKYGLPATHYGPSQAGQVAGGARGIVGHDTITAAFPQDYGDHTDPGASFPWSTFLGYITSGGSPMADTDIPSTYHAAVAADAWGLSAITGQPAKFYGGSSTTNPSTLPNALHDKLDAIKTAVTAPATLALSQADRDAIVAALAALIPTPEAYAAAVLDEQHRRDAA